MMKYMDEGKQTLEREIEKILKMGDLSVSTLEKLHMLTDTYKNMCKIEMYAELDDGGESYEDGVSYARGRGINARRDSMGRYSRNDGYSEAGRYSRTHRGDSYGYSRDGAVEKMIDKIDEMMDEVESPKERKALMECREALERA